MSVTTEVQPVTFPLPSDDPRRPLATWWGTPVGTGDATGGFNRARILLARPSLYSVEGVAVLTSAAINVFVNFAPGRTGYGWTFTIQTRAAGVGFSGVGSDMVLPWRGLVVDPGPDGDAALDSDIANVLAGTIEMDAWGYIWDRAALLAPGGPRRPRRTLFEPAGG